MTASFSVYNHQIDYELVNQFLYQTYEKNKYPNDVYNN